MANISKVQEILKDGKHGQKIVLDCQGSSESFRGHIVQLGTDIVKGVDIDDWQKGWPSGGTTLKIYCDIDDESARPNMHVFIDDVEKQFGQDIEITPNKSYQLKFRCNESSKRFRRLSDEPDGTNHGTYEYTYEKSFSQNTVLTAYFSTEWS